MSSHAHCKWCGGAMRPGETTRTDKNGETFHAGDCYLQHCLVEHAIEKGQASDATDEALACMPDAPWPPAEGL